MKKKVLILAGYYTPSINAGGPIQSIRNLVENLSNKFEFYIVALDRDKGDTVPFTNIVVNKWVQVGKAKVYYINPSALTWGRIAKIINSENFDILYLNSFFDYKLSIIPILLNKVKIINCKQIIVAPRGGFSTGALGLKSFKKKLLIIVSKLLKLHDRVTWHATAGTEKKDIQNIFGNRINIKTATNLTANYNELRYDKSLEKKKGELKIIFISRIHPKKNLKSAIKFIKQLNGDIDFSIYGPIEDKIYWTECEKEIKKLPATVNVFYRGAVAHNEIHKIFKKHHVLLFPTLGENFGHVISEALIGGCPIIISDQTPWRNIEEEQVGWDIKLSEENKFSEIIQYCIDLSDDEYKVISKRAFEFGKGMSKKGNDIDDSLKLFET
ncbi:MAG: glycosyltransferase family 4 protein [Bacillota bacterium]